MAQDPGQKFPADVSLMGIGKSYGLVTLDHELMLAAGVLARKSQFLKASYQLFSADGSKCRHQATSLMVSSMPSIAGRGRWR
jgi:hypothetical protein